VADPGSAVQVGVIGRDAELAVLGRFLGARSRARALVLNGEAGIGKTTLWEAGVDAARERGMRVLVARASGAEARLSFAALIDLLEPIGPEALARLPAPQCSALEVALLRAEPARVPPEPGAIALGLCNALRALAGAGPVLIAIDDVQWLDAPSADALAFAARRMHGEPVAFLLAKRANRRSVLEQALEPPLTERIQLGALSLGATRRLLSTRLGLTLPRLLLRRVVDSTLGNPLFALEVGRSLIEQGIPSPGADLPVPDSVQQMFERRLARLPREVRRVLLVVALSADVDGDVLSAVVGSGALEDAIDAGLVVLDGDRVRASHPLFAAVAKKRARARERRELHLALAEAVVDAELRALHLALATERPDGELAATVAAAARAAAARGARRQAVVLAEHALRLTPSQSHERSERLLALAEFLETAGELQRLTDLLAPAVQSLPRGALRARAYLLLSEGADVKTIDEYQRRLDLALADCDRDPGLRAFVLATKAIDRVAGAIDHIGEAEAWALEALPAAARQSAPEVERRVLYAQSWASAMRGRPVDEACVRFLAASDDAYYLAASPERVAGQRLVWRGELHQARTCLERLLALADERGEPISYAMQRLHLCELELRAGAWDAAARLLDEWAESAERELLILPKYERCRALLAAGSGLRGEAKRWTAKALARAEATGAGWDRLEALRAHGIAALLDRDPARAAESLRVVWRHTEREGVDEPGVFPVAPDLVEALVELDELDEARAVIDRLRRLAEDQAHPWGLATTKRCSGVLALASDAYDDAAAAALADAASDYGRLGLRFDRARSLLSLGRSQRRLKQWGAARDSLGDAVAAFDELTSVGWAQRTRAEIERVGGRRPRASDELTPTERDIVALAARGLANKEIARALSIAVHTVEVHLSRAYAKLGVRSRSQLAARLSGRT
jgi:DNA-binding CsgD family transcriptional regulator